MALATQRLGKNSASQPNTPESLGLQHYVPVGVKDGLNGSEKLGQCGNQRDHRKNKRGRLASKWPKMRRELRAARGLTYSLIVGAVLAGGGDSEYERRELWRHNT